MKTKRNPMPEVSLSEEGPVRHLHLGTPWIQGSMDMERPDRLVHEYIRRMMAWLLFADLSAVGRMQALQLGLGAGSLTRFCHRVLKMKTVVVELNPAVIQACKAMFKLPAEGPRLGILNADASQVVRSADWLGRVDALQVDLYDHEAAAPVLDDVEFYVHCRGLLTDAGCMTVNLFGRSASFDRSRDTIAQAFGADAVWWFRPTLEGNAVVLALRTPRQPQRGELAVQAASIADRWGLPAGKWLRALQRPPRVGTGASLR
jgi:spermidine synthase